MTQVAGRSIGRPPARIREDGRAQTRIASRRPGKQLTHEPHQLAFVLLLAIRAVACGFAMAVVLSSNIVRMAFYLILSLGATAGLVLPGRGRFCRRDAIDDLRRRHAGVAGLRRDAHGPGPIHFDENTRRRLDSGRSSRLPVGHARAGGVQRLAQWPGRARSAVPTATGRSKLPQATATRPLGMGLLGVRVDKLDTAGRRCSRGCRDICCPLKSCRCICWSCWSAPPILARAKRRDHCCCRELPD